VTRPEPIDLLRRRGDLLASRDDPTELAALTTALSELFEHRPPEARPLDQHADLPLAERLAEQEPVNPVRDREDLLDRLDVDRRCIVLEHPDLPGVVLNVVWCALWSGPADDLGAILDPDAPAEDPAGCDTAVFYSIWNAHPGVAGLSGGRTLIERAGALLGAELPSLATFLTLSPLPGFRAWLEDPGDTDHPGKPVDPADAQALRRAAAQYLTDLDAAGRPVDPVARFHLGNGARLLAVHADADRSELGRGRSHGVMANYRYGPEDRAANRAALRGGRPATSAAVRALARRAPAA
jgi:malonyl-CoA decarboxylase